MDYKGDRPVKDDPIVQHMTSIGVSYPNKAAFFFPEGNIKRSVVE